MCSAGSDRSHSQVDRPTALRTRSATGRWAAVADRAEPSRARVVAAAARVAGRPSPASEAHVAASPSRARVPTASDGTRTAATKAEGPAEPDAARARARWGRFVDDCAARPAGDGRGAGQSCDADGGPAQVKVVESRLGPRQGACTRRYGRRGSSAGLPPRQQSADSIRVRRESRPKRGCDARLLSATSSGDIGGDADRTLRT